MQTQIQSCIADVTQIAAALGGMRRRPPDSATTALSRLLVTLGELALARPLVSNEPASREDDIEAEVEKRLEARLETLRDEIRQEVEADNETKIDDLAQKRGDEIAEELLDERTEEKLAEALPTAAEEQIERRELDNRIARILGFRRVEAP